MTPEALEKSATSSPNPPSDLTDVQRVLWLARAGQWDKAHDQCQNLESPAAEWIHAHLHREEGDLSNANYWYSLAGQPSSTASLIDEWRQLAKEFC